MDTEEEQQNGEAQLLNIPVVSLYSINAYSFGTKERIAGDKDNSATARLARMKEKYAKEGMRRTVEAVLLVMEHGVPHILLLQVGTMYFKLPGGKLKPHEGDEQGLVRKLNAKLASEVSFSFPLLC
jgi:cleavage and polyadenylation specificity factor subunit 5